MSELSLYYLRKWIGKAWSLWQSFYSPTSSESTSWKSDFLLVSRCRYSHFLHFFHDFGAMNWSEPHFLLPITYPNRWSSTRSRVLLGSLTGKLRMGEHQSRIRQYARWQRIRSTWMRADIYNLVPFCSLSQITSPCWLIRPSDLFTRFLSHWPRLNFLKLGNFMFDMTFAHSITSISTLSTLTLLGSSNKNIDPQVLQLLLNHPILSRRLRLLELGDVPLLKRREIEDSLNNEEHRFSSRTSLGYINMGSDTISDPFQNVHSPGIRILDDATGNGGCSCLGLGCRSLDCYRKDCEWSKFQREKERHRHCNSRICPIYSYGTTVAEEEHQFRTFSSTSTSHSINIESSTSTSASIYSSTTSSSSPTESIPSLSSSPTSTFSTSHSSTSMRRFPSIQSCPFLNSRRSSSLLSSSQESSTYEMNWDSEWEFEETEDRMDWQSSPLGSMASGFASLGTGRRSSRKRSGVLRWIP